MLTLLLIMANIAYTGNTKAEQSTSSVSSFTTTAMTVTAGNAIVACMSSSANTTLTASDSKGDSFSDDVTKSVATCSTGIDVATNIAGGSTTFTVTPGVSSFCTISAQEYSGMDPAPKEATNTGTAGTTAVNPGAVNPASSNDLYVACWTHDSGTSHTSTFNVSGEGWAQRANLTNAANMPLFSQDLISSGSRTGSATLSGSPTTAWVAAVGTFKAGTGAGVFRRVSRPFPFKPGGARSW